MACGFDSISNKLFTIENEFDNLNLASHVYNEIYKITTTIGCESPNILEKIRMNYKIAKPNGDILNLSQLNREVIWWIHIDDDCAYIITSNKIICTAIQVSISDSHLIQHKFVKEINFDAINKILVKKQGWWRSLWSDDELIFIIKDSENPISWSINNGNVEKMRSVIRLLMALRK